jgi:hypothetical protein
MQERSVTSEPLKDLVIKTVTNPMRTVIRALKTNLSVLFERIYRGADLLGRVGAGVNKGANKSLTWKSESCVLTIDTPHEELGTKPVAAGQRPDIRFTFEQLAAADSSIEQQQQKQQQQEQQRDVDRPRLWKNIDASCKASTGSRQPILWRNPLESLRSTPSGIMSCLKPGHRPSPVEPLIRT